MDPIKLEVDNNVVFRYHSQFLSLVEMRISNQYFSDKYRFAGGTDNVQIFHQNENYFISYYNMFINDKKLVDYTILEILDLQGKYTITDKPAEKTYYFHFIDQTMTINYNQECATFPITMNNIKKVLESGIVKNIVVPPDFDTSNFPPITIVFR